MLRTTDSLLTRDTRH